MIKIEIQTLQASLDIEIKTDNNQYNLLVLLSKSAYFKESGRAWHGKTTEGEKVQTIIELIQNCYANPSAKKSITINDGRLIKIASRSDSADINFNLADTYEEHAIENQLVKALYDFTTEIIQDEILDKYMKELL